KLEQQFGINPYQFGLIGSSDAHTGLSAMEEDNFFGKTTPQEPSPERMMNPFVVNSKTGVKVMDWEVSSSGYAAVWATENTREAIWDGMKRKETFATTGTRMRVRVFGGWGFEEGDLARSDFAANGYENGVPMGGDLTNAPEGAAPTLLIRALRDPDGANLDRVQVVKGWTTADGEPQEKVYDVAWSDDRQPSADGKLPAVGNTVNIEEATYDNSIGAPFLQAYWKDPDFDPAERAFYYVRVLEIPTPSWLSYDHVAFGVEVPKGKAKFQQERAYTSPIWYTPKG
ncbi:MAG: DUF3604 domain-containing protein, partial [Kiloniellales bacterium]|nr:DUF3604 domain-containing protein [Kiloniellales bacterium]